MEEKDIAEQIIYGSMLGDGGIARNGHRYYERHAISQKNYLIWKNHYLKCKYVERDYGYKFCEIFSRKNPMTDDLRELVYIDGKKTVTPQLLEKLSVLGILVWYLDDGTFNYSTKIIYFCTNCFDDRQHEMMINWFIKKYDIHPKIMKKKNSWTKKVEDVLYFPRAETDKLLDMLYPLFREYLLPDCMTYKMGHYASENKAKLEEKKKDRRAGRQISIYIKPYLYNELLALCKKNNNREIIGILHGTFPRREITGYTILPFPSTRSGVYGDKDAISKVIEETVSKDTVIGWFHSHVRDYNLPSVDDMNTHIQLFKGRMKYLLVIVNVPAHTMRIYDHAQRSGSYRICQPVLNDNYTRRALPGNAVIVADLKSGINPCKIAEKYGVSPAAVYSLLRRQGIPTHF